MAGGPGGRWHAQIPYTEADRQADRFTHIHSGHVYRSRADTPLPADARVWMSEWSPDGNTWHEAWDDGSGWAGISGAESVHHAGGVGITPIRALLEELTGSVVVLYRVQARSDAVLLDELRALADAKGAQLRVLPGRTGTGSPPSAAHRR